MKDRLIDKRVIAASGSVISLMLSVALIPMHANGQESQQSTEVEQTPDSLRATAIALEVEIFALRERIAETQRRSEEERAALSKLEARREQALKELALLKQGNTNAAELFAEGIKHWKVLDNFPSNGGLIAGDEPGVFQMKMGDPLSGIRYDGPLELPVTNYEITLDARRVKGTDFFCGLTFPVNSVKTCCTFVAGGWGGALAGISSLEGMDAANNDTSTFHKFEANQWYSFRIQVTPEFLKVWMDEKSIADVELADRRVGMRWGDIEYCAPFGLASYQTTAEFRNLKVRRLDDKPLEQKKEVKAAPEAKGGAAKE